MTISSNFDETAPNSLRGTTFAGFGPPPPFGAPQIVKPLKHQKWIGQKWIWPKHDGQKWTGQKWKKWSNKDGPKRIGKKTVSAWSSGVRGLFATPCCVQGCTVHVGASRVRDPIPPQWRDQCRVHGELGTMEERPPVNHDFDREVVKGFGAVRSWTLTFAGHGRLLPCKTRAAADSRTP